MGSIWLFLRVLKFLGIAVFGAGLWTSITAERQSTRQMSAHVLALVGFCLTWLAGYGLLKLNGQSMGEPFVRQAMLASLLAYIGGLLAATRPSASYVGAGLAAAGLAASVTSMVARATASASLRLSLIYLVPLILGIACALAARLLPKIQADAAARERTIGWFRWVARAEGASLILLVCISMPLRKIWDISIDGGQGWIGWVHGMLVMLYIPALAFAARAGRWGAVKGGLGFVASLIPGGTFIFERQVIEGKGRKKT